jgi:environmental stress-induced protein Ves
MPWKNGLGQTAEIDRHPASADRYFWRLSQAWIQGDSPFSAFPGFDRWLYVWKGDGVFLNEKRLPPLQPLRFSGDEKIHCRLIGAPVVDVGLIFDREKIAAEMRMTEGALNLPDPGADGAYYLFDLSSGDTLKITAAAQFETPKSLLISVRSLSRS